MYNKERLAAARVVTQVAPQTLPTELSHLLIKKDLTEFIISNKNCRDKYHLIYDAFYYRNFLWPTNKLSLIQTLKFDNTAFNKLTDLYYIKLIINLSTDCKTLDLSSNDLGHQEVEEILNAIASSSIEVLYLRNLRITLNFERLANVIEHSNLVKLDLSGNSVNAFEVFNLQRVLAKRKKELTVVLGDLTFTVAEAKKIFMHLASSVAPSISSKREHATLFQEEENDFDSKDMKRQKTVTLKYDDKELSHQSFLDSASLLVPSRRLSIENAIRTLFVGYNAQDLKDKPQDLRFRDDCRQFSQVYPRSFFDNRFLYYNINQVEEGYFLSPGPHDELSVDRMLTEICHDDSSIKKIIAVGDPGQEEGYFDYFSRSHTYNNFIVNLMPPSNEKHDQIHPRIRSYELNVINKETKNSKTIILYHVSSRAGKTSCLINDYDLKFYTNLSLQVAPDNILIHCDTGLGYAPMIAFSMQLFRKFTQFFSGSAEDVAEKIMTQIAYERKKINGALFPHINFVLNSINLAMGYAKNHTSELKSKQISFTHESVPVKKILLLGNPKKSEELASLLENRGLKPILFDLDSWEQLFNSEGNSPESPKLQQIMQSIFFQIKYHFKLNNLCGIIIHDSFSDKSLVGHLVKSLPKEIVTIFLKAETDLVSNSCQLTVDGPNLPLILDGLLRHSVVKPLRIEKQTSSVLFLGPLHCESAEFYCSDLKNVESSQLNIIKLINSKVNYQLIPYLVNEEGVSHLVEVTVLEVRDELNPRIKLKDFPLVDQPLKNDCQYIIIPDIIDSITVSSMVYGRRCSPVSEGIYHLYLTDEECFEIGQAIAERANLLAPFCDVKIVLPLKENKNEAVLAVDCRAGVLRGICSKLKQDDENFQSVILKKEKNTGLLDSAFSLEKNTKFSMLLSKTINGTVFFAGKKIKKEQIPNKDDDPSLRKC